jgi:hypothetical protein
MAQFARHKSGHDRCYPLIAYIAGTPASVGRFELLALAVICFLLALILHKIGSDILAGIRV